MEGSDTLRKEYARLSKDWVCRECGRSNAEIMRELWEACEERGVEVDVEGREDIVGSDGNGNGEGNKEGKAHEVDTDSVKRENTRGEAGGNDASITASTQSEVQVQSTNTPTAPLEAPRPPQSLQSASVQTQNPSSPPPRAAPTATSTANSVTPANSPWLDRAIVIVVVALILLILRRTVDMDDL